MSVLDRILARKAEEVAELRAASEDWTARVRDAEPARDFAHALQSGEGPRVVAEFKRASPSKGTIRAGADPAEIASAYAHAGARALSVLTDREFFQGSVEDLKKARAACALPVLRKDFIIDPLQVSEARAIGADAVLLIVAALAPAQLRDLLGCVVEHAMDALVEVHTRTELESALEAGARLLGVNNRDLHSFKTDVGVTRELLPHVAGRTVVSESGFEDAETLLALQREGVHAFLIGEALMREDDPGLALRRLRGEA